MNWYRINNCSVLFSPRKTFWFFPNYVFSKYVFSIWIVFQFWHITNFSVQILYNLAFYWREKNCIVFFEHRKCALCFKWQKATCYHKTSGSERFQAMRLIENILSKNALIFELIWKGATLHIFFKVWATLLPCTTLIIFKKILTACLLIPMPSYKFQMFCHITCEQRHLPEVAFHGCLPWLPPRIHLPLSNAAWIKGIKTLMQQRLLIIWYNWEEMKINEVEDGEAISWAACTAVFSA